MKLRNTKTGEIGYFCFANWSDPVLIIMDKDGVQLAKYNSLAELNEEWEDYEEPKLYWYINTEMFDIDYDEVGKNDLVENFNKQIGNYFGTREDAEKAVEKLEAWKRLRDKGFRFKTYSPMHMTISYGLADYEEETEKDLDLLFGGEG